MSYQVALLNFEGPLDLLLQLIEKSELSVTEISLGSVTEQYLSHLEQLKDLDPIELNLFVELAAKLCYLKSMALLPSLQDEDADEELSELAEQLEQYRHYQKATAYIGGLLKTPVRSWHRPQKLSLPADKIPDPDISIDALSQMFQSVLAKLPVTDESTLTENISLDAMMDRIRQRKEASLGLLLAAVKSRMEALVLFLALLELTKSREVSVDQHNQFGDIVITYA